MDMEAAGAGLVAEVAQADGFPQNGSPGHLPLVKVQRHGMGHQFQAIIQRAVVLDIEKFQAIGVAYAQ